MMIKKRRRSKHAGQFKPGAVGCRLTMPANMRPVTRSGPRRPEVKNMNDVIRELNGLDVVLKIVGGKWTSGARWLRGKK